MPKLAKSPVYLGDLTMEAVAALADDLRVELGRRVTYGEVVERAIEVLRKERETAQ